jgi:hypothetical protein
MGCQMNKQALVEAGLMEIDEETLAAMRIEEMMEKIDSLTAKENRLRDRNRKLLMEREEMFVQKIEMGQKLESVEFDLYKEQEKSSNLQETLHRRNEQNRQLKDCSLILMIFSKDNLASIKIKSETTTMSTL